MPITDLPHFRAPQISTGGAPKPNKIKGVNYAHMKAFGPMDNPNYCKQFHADDEAAALRSFDRAIASYRIESGREPIKVIVLNAPPPLPEN